MSTSCLVVLLVAWTVAAVGVAAIVRELLFWRDWRGKHRK